jgi:putative transposase
MARPLRIEFPEALYHVTARGIEKKSIFQERGDKLKLLKRVTAVNEKYGFIFYAYCIMDNHYHLLLETPLGNLSRGMQNLNSTYAQWYNKRHKRCGPVFQGRFSAYLIEKDNYLLAAARYIVLNPVKAGIVSDAMSYTWSSFRYMMGKRDCPEFLDVNTILECFSHDPRAARRLFRSYVGQGLEEDEPDYLEKGPVRGSGPFMDKVEERFAASGKFSQKEISRKERFFNRPALSSLFSEPCDRHIREIRNARIGAAFLQYGYSQKEIADFLGLGNSTISCIIQKQDINNGNGK